MKKELDNGVNSYLIMNQDGFIDISSGPSPDNQNNYIDSGDMNVPMAFATVDEEYDIGNKRMGGQSGGSSKKPIIVAVLALLAATAVGVIGYTAYMRYINSDESEGAPLFTYAANSVVSGIDISGKTVSQAKKLLEQNKDKFLAPVTLEIDVNGETTELRENHFTYTYNIEEVLRRMRMDTEFADASVGKKDGSYSITATVTDESIKKNVEKICEERNCAPKNARVAAFHPYEAKRFEFDGAKWGITVNAKTLNAQIKECFETGNTKTTITADIEKKAADMSMGELEDKLVKLASYETYSTNTANGTSNMRVALESCNGAVIEPGETWSFNESTGDSNKESNGYKSASVIVEGKLTEGIGGGICQASSTIYNAAVRANMKIVERYNHKWASSYVPTGLDATIDYPNLDLKLGNTTNCQMFIECKVVGTTLYCSVWGEKPADYDEIRTHNEQGEAGEKSYEVRAWRLYFKDGKEVDREELPKSSYDKEYGVVFTQADNDPQAKNTNVDNVSDGNTSSRTNESSSGNSYSDNDNYRNTDNDQSSNSSETPQSQSQSESQSSASSSGSSELPFESESGGGSSDAGGSGGSESSGSAEGGEGQNE